MDDPNIGSGRGIFSGVAGIAAGVAAYAGSQFLYTKFIEHLPYPNWHQLLMFDLHTPIGYQPIAPTIAGLLTAAGVGIGLYTITHEKNERHIRGRQITYRPKDVSQSIVKPDGVYIHPKVRMTQNLERNHILLLGGSGSGKTSIMWPLINQAVKRGDKALILSLKNDFQEKIDASFSLLAPWDSRTVNWQLGQDIQTFQDAQALAQTLIKEPEREPMWARGGQDLLVAIIAYLQKKHGIEWGYAELGQLCAECLADYKLLIYVVGENNPVAKIYLASEEGNKTSMGFLVELASGLSNVINLGVAAHSMPDNKTWSINHFLNNEKAKKVAIIGYRPSLKEFSKTFASSILEQLVRQLADLPDCAPNERRIWLFLDEVAQFGKIPSITVALETLRSKGVRVVLGMQSTSQIEKEYDRHDLSIWTGQCDTKIIGRIRETNDQKWAADLVGERELERYHHQFSAPTGGAAGTPSKSQNWQRVTEKVLMPAEFGQTLSAKYPKPIHALALIDDDHVAILKWPYPQLKTLRPSVTPAVWSQPGYNRPPWGVVPPPVAALPSPEPLQQRKQEQEADAGAFSQSQSSSFTPDPNYRPSFLPPEPLPALPVQESGGDLMDAILDAVRTLHSGGLNLGGPEH